MAVETVALQDSLQLIQQQHMERFKSRKTISSKWDDSEGLCPDQNREDDIPFSAHHHHHRVDLDPDAVLDLKTATQEDKTKESSRSMKSNTGSRLQVPECDRKATEVEEEYLKSQIEQLQSENARLKSDLKATEQKFTEFKKARAEERAALGAVGSSATQRIVELSKKNRELSAELATEKNKVRQLQKKVKESEKYISQIEQPTNSSGGGRQSAHKSSLNQHPANVACKCQDDSAAVIAQLQDQLQQLKMKIAEQRNQCQVLKQELKLAQKVITKEVGEGVSVSALLSGVSGWRGRAQQIISLQSKLAELGEQLRQEKLKSSSHVQSIASYESSEAYLTGPLVDRRQKAALRKIETGKQKNLKEVRSELETLRSEYTQIQQQCSALKARNKTLTGSVKTMKAELTSLTKKQSLTNGSMQRAESSTSDRSMFEDGSNTLQYDLQRERQLLRQENQTLRVQLDELQLRAAKGNTELRTNSYYPQAHCNPDNQRSPLPPVISKAGQMSMERKAVTAGQPPGPFHKGADMNKSNIYIQVSEVERERLLELNKCLQQRLDTTTDKLMKLDIESRTLRQQNAQMEKMIGRSRTSGGNGSKVVDENEKVREIETQLAIQMDVNAVLKETLELTRHQKIEDMKQYQKLIHETKMLLF